MYRGGEKRPSLVVDAEVVFVRAHCFRVDELADFDS